MNHRLPRSYGWLIRVLLMALLALTGAFAGAMSASAAPRFNPPKQYTLVLGDSLAFGYQDARFKTELISGKYNPADFTGYWAPFATQLATLRPGIQTINYGCPGETTASFVAGGCLFRTNPFTGELPLHDNYSPATPQLQAALAFLHEHPGQVSPITVSLGANDVIAMLNGCQAQFPTDPQAVLICINTNLPGTLDAVRANLSTTLAALHNAAPSSEIIVLQPYDPYIALIPALTPGVQALNATLAAVATAAQARVADGFSAVTPATVCTLTLICTPQHDIHPSDAGYAMLAQALWAASGYDRLLADDQR
ncbi:MAG: SGNH/GDSL hydrolase family protein [Thermomicrobiales bacterium]